MKHWVLWLIAGIISLAGGIFALANPLAATLAANLIAGWSFIAAGIVTVFTAFEDKGWGGRILTIVIGVLILLLGVSLIAHPLKGIASLTVTVALMLIVVGVCRLLLGFSLQVARLRWALVISGLLSLILAAMIFANYPQSATVTLGIILAAELISNGVSLIVLSLTRKSNEVAA